jgi:hypothetical protein
MAEKYEVGSDKLVTVVIPARLAAKAGTVPVHLENERGRSNTVNFVLQ